jgi:hypothetical protein
VADISKINNVPIANIAKVNNVAKASIADVDGIDVPASGPTASDNLVHWWKMNEGSTTSATDYGSAVASGTALTMNGVTAVSGGGPSALSSPNHVSTDGVNDTINTKTYNSSTRTAVGDVFENTGGLSLSLWMKIPANQGMYDTFWFAGDRAYTTNAGAGMMYYDSGSNDAFWNWFERNNYTSPATYSVNDITQSSVGTDWAHWAYTFPAAGQAKIYVNGSLVHTYATKDPVDTVVLAGTHRWLSFGSLTRLVGSGENNYYWAEASFSDIRLYDKELNSTEVAAINSGDW